MKYIKALIIQWLALIVLILPCSCNSKVKVTPEKFRLSFAADSGYISSGDALHFLLDAALIDTTGGKSDEDYFEYAYSFGEFPKAEDSTRYYKFWYINNPTDTIGKYYAFNNTGNYVVALSLGNDVLVMELTPQSNVVDCNLHGHGSHACCWDSLDDMLKRYGPYFGISTCGTGTSYCSSYLTLFNDRIDVPQSENSIPAYEFVGAWGAGIPGHILTSEMEFADSCLIMHYELEEFIELLDENDESLGEKSISTRQFTVKFIYRDGRFETDEADKFNGILM